MASTNRVVPMLVAGAAGVAGAFYVFSPKTELSGKPSAAPPKDGRSQAAKDGTNSDSPSASSPHPALKYGGAAPQNPGSQTVAGTTKEGRQGYSADHNPATHSGDKGGFGVKEMKERKESGSTQGLAGQLGNKSTTTAGGEKKGRWWLFGY